MPLQLNTVTSQGVNRTKTDKRPIAWTKQRSNVAEELVCWARLGGEEPDTGSFEQDFLEAIGDSETLLNTPPMEEEGLQTTEMTGFHDPEWELQSGDSEWDMHADLTGLQPHQPTEQELYDGMLCVAPAEAEGRLPSVAAEVTITTNNTEQLNIIDDRKSSIDFELLMSELYPTTTVVPEPVAPDNLEMEAVADQTKDLEQLNIINDKDSHNNNNNTSEILRNTPAAILPELVAPDDLEMEIVADQQNNPELTTLTNTWMEEYLEADNFIGIENFMDTFEAVIKDSSDITAFPVEVERNPLVPEPEKQEPAVSILQQAIEGAGVDQAAISLYPVADVKIEVIEEDEEWVEPKPRVRRVSKRKGSSIVKKESRVSSKKVGRPARKEPIQITELPKDEAGLSEEQRSALKYRRMRDLNNEASRKCRKNRKVKAAVAGDQLAAEQARNVELTQKLQKMELKIKDLQDKLTSIGLLVPAYC